ncbi:histidine kinase [Aureimonas endophytica]|uniref:histidine kinase n=1 Tax=Aureimonas endophytica TaxID=2027858 RepID=A0A916ZDL5_9HYPH|nr:sensor histidine kinase [Aureimonas endophytica]GGD90192.1 histidine kinase [Aureimonas endophytica]
MRLPRPQSLRGRLMLIAAVATLVATLLAAVAMGLALQGFVTRQIDQRLDSQAAAILGGLERGPDDSLRLAYPVDGPPFDRRNPGWFWQVEAGGEARLLSGSLLGAEPLHPLPDEAEPPRRRPPGPPLRSRPVAIADDERLHARRLAGNVGGLPVEIVVTAPRQAIAGPMGEALTPVLLSMLALGIGLVAAIWVQVRYGLRPLEALRQDLAAVRDGRAEAIPVDQPSEIRPLAAELNALLRENEAGLERARRHVANLAHGLKTPLADLALSLAAAERDPDGTARHLVEDMDRRVRHHLARARAAALGGSARAAVPLRERAADLLSVLSRIHRERDHAVSIEIAPELRVACETQDLDEMLGNLLDNAFKWARSRVCVAAEPAGSELIVRVEDDGAGLAADEVPEALVPGRRLDEMQPGHGFGLSITRELAELYGGSLAITRSGLGGLSATLRLPAARG